MDNDFERQFRQNISVAPSPAITPVPTPVEPPSTKNRYKTLFFVFVVVTIIETITLVVLLFVLLNRDTEPSYLSFDDENIEYDEELDDGLNNEDIRYVFDNDGNLTSFDLTCTNGDTSYVFSKYNLYQNGDEEGEYSITRNFIISMSDYSGSEYTLYYDGFIMADGKTIYECS